MAGRDDRILMNHFERLATMIYDIDSRQEPTLTGIKDKYLMDVTYTLKFLRIAIEVKEPMIFDQYMKWFGGLACHLRFNLDAMRRHFDIFESVLTTHVEKEISERGHDIFVSGVDAFKQAYLTTTPVDPSPNRFLELLMNMESDQAYQYVNQKINEGTTLKDVYLSILQPTLYTVGELWHQRQISVAKEHYITAAIQHIIGKLYPLLFQNKKRSPYSVTAVCAGEELHEIGMRMVADFFEMSGWDSVFLGSNLPIEMVVEHLLSHPSDLLAISATTSQHLIEVRTLIETVKEHPDLKTIKIMVGGKVFNDTPDLWQRINADAYAADAEQAVLMARLLVGESDV